MDPMNEPLSDEPEGAPKPWRIAIIFGLIGTPIVFLLGWITGTNGGFGGNLRFSLLTGIFSTILFYLFLKWRARP